MYTSINSKVIKNPEESAACKLIRKVTNALAKVQPVKLDDIEILKSLPAQTLIMFGNEDSPVYKFTAGQLVETCETCNKVNFAEVEKLESQVAGLRESIKRHNQPVEIALSHFAVNAPAEKKESKGKSTNVKVNPFVGLLD